MKPFVHVLFIITPFVSFVASGLYAQKKEYYLAVPFLLLGLFFAMRYILVMKSK